MSVTLIVVLVIVVLLVLWGVKVQNRLVKQDELCNNALKQISVQQTSRYDALETAVNIAREENEVEGENFRKILEMRRITASPNPTVAEINANEAALGQMAARLMAVAEQYPDLKGAQAYQDSMHKYFEFEENVRMSRMTFNDSVTKYNRDVRSFPASILAGMFGFPVREYLAEQKEKAELPKDLFKKR